ncbi:ribonuclease R [Vibrio cholerae]|uniref:ribonuclease R n=1 Tax=Vibrio cholerae TaxID=666 RepID=UPI00066431A3|nr:ribonuclease R [Vibrio cholerae]ELP4886785.1 ribonuclease R [Vibrio cholerae]ELT8460124.1 ribonuclease R [Vibrio cholerae]CSD79060.1 ribonuclease R [Vibrio cholerae]
MKLNLSASAINITHYDHVIPSRDCILSLFDKVKHYLSYEQISHSTGLSEKNQKEALKKRLRAMERDGQLTFTHRRGYQKVDQTALVSGRISLHADGFGFVSYDDNQKDLFLPKHQLDHVFDGDIVQVLKGHAQQQGRSNHRLIKIVERKTTHIVGLLKKKGVNFYLSPEKSTFSQLIHVNPNQFTAKSVGKLVYAQVTQYPDHKHSTMVEITEVLGRPGDSGIEVKLALRRHGINEKWESEVLSAALALGTDVNEKDKMQRVDYRDLPFVTIDGDDAKDFDDAVYGYPMDNGQWKLFVAIADVSHYVQPNDPLDLEAQTRATSVYFPGYVVPMLPEALSNGLCSLNPNVDRLVLVCEMTFDDAGIMLDAEFSEGLIHSHARLTYNQVNETILKPNQWSHSRSNKVEKHLLNLHRLYLNLLGQRQVRGAIDFDTQELAFTLDNKKKIASIDPVIRNDAHRMIEEFMLCANVATAAFLQEHKIPSLYRVHAGPQMKKLASLRMMLADKGLVLGGGDKPTSHDYNALLEQVHDLEEGDVIRTLLLRSQSQAEYSPKNQGHFGLAYGAYAHFTSPIRRYPDLLVHRAIRSKLREQAKGTFQRLLNKLKSLGQCTGGSTNYPYDSKAIEQLSVHCSHQSRQADEVSREVENALKCHYMKPFIGQNFTGRVSGVTHFGLFVELESNRIEGLVPLSSFQNGEFEFDGGRQKIVSQTATFALGTQVEITVKEVDAKQRRILFSFAE